MSQQDNRRGSGVQNRDPNAFLQAFMNLFTDTSKTEAAKRRQEMLYEKKYGKKPLGESVTRAFGNEYNMSDPEQVKALNLKLAEDQKQLGNPQIANFTVDTLPQPSIVETKPEPKVDFDQSEPVSGGSGTVVPTFTMADLVGSDIEVGDMFAPQLKFRPNDEIAQAFLAEKMPVKNPEPVKKAKEPHPLSHFYPNRHQFK